MPVAQLLDPATSGRSDLSLVGRSARGQNVCMTATAWTPELWSQPEFLAQIEEWASAHVGPIRSLTRVKDRPWAAVWRVDAEAGVFYAKQNCPAQPEAHLSAVLARVAPALVVPPVAVDVQRDLLLTADQGTIFRETAASDDAEAWRLLLSEAMLLARATAGHLDELALTVLDPLDASGLTAQVRETWQVPAAMRAEVDRALDQAVRDAEQLAAVGIPFTLVHNDLHDANAFFIDGSFRFFDFADAVALPALCALMVPLGVYGRRVGAATDDPRVLAVAEAALEVWSDLAPMRALRTALPAALRLGAVGRAESWHRIFATIPPRYFDDDYKDADVEWLIDAAGVSS